VIRLALVLPLDATDPLTRVFHTFAPQLTRFQYSGGLDTFVNKKINATPPADELERQTGHIYTNGPGIGPNTNPMLIRGRRVV
jgi:hypothetical protein